MMPVQDQMGSTIYLDRPPKRIISLVPSQTELLYDLGLEHNVVGITRFCIYPNTWLNNKVKIGGTKSFDFETIQQLQPDLIIGNKEENYQEGIAELKKHFKVWMSDIYNLEDALEMIVGVGQITNTAFVAEQIASDIKTRFDLLKSTNLNRKRVAYFIWRKPYMVAAGNTFINAMIKSAGFENCFEGLDRYPTIQLGQLNEAKPDYILLSSEPYAFKAVHESEFQEACPNAKVVLVNGEMFSWYGSRLLLCPAYFKALSKKLSS